MSNSLRFGAHVATCFIVGSLVGQVISLENPIGVFIALIVVMPLVALSTFFWRSI